jgi:putative transposase
VIAAIDGAVAELVPLLGAKAACQAVGMPRASYYRGRPGDEPDQLLDVIEDASEPMLEPLPASMPGVEEGVPQRRPQAQPRALSVTERAKVLEVLHSERFADAAPATVYATLLDEGTYLASESTMYRLLRERGETGDRRRHATHPAKVKPELVAHGPNQCWSWDIERHEALLNRAVAKGHLLRPVVAGRVKLRAAWIPGTGARVEAALTTTGRASTARWPGSG